ncbi:P-loop containing nucleoside triphosphate hydrolase protein [Lentinula raphanica]|nr:P-loop containing nucleoside triphosphate hydrolase protein [Lentinula raphanica]
MTFWSQFSALFWKNWIILSKHSLLNIIRCFVLPVAYGIFLAVAQLFLIKPNNYGIGNPIPVYRLQDRFDGSISLVWADGTNSSSTGGITPTDIISHISTNFSTTQRNAIRKVASPSDIPSECPQNFNLFSECFAAVAFFDLPSPGSGSINYTILADGGLVHIDVVKHTSDFEERILPLQWAIDQAIVELQTGVQLPTPLEWPFSQETNEEQSTDIRLSYIRGLRTLLVLALFICYVGIAYQLPGAVTGERANLVTSHMKAMGLLDSAKVLSWYTSIALVYLPAWTIVSLIWHFRIFTMTSAGLIFVVHLLLGLILASYSFFIAAPFGKSPQLAAVASTFLSIVFAILALVFSRASTGAAFIFSIIFPPGWYIFAIRAICGWENHQIATNVLQGDPDDGLVLLPLLIAAIIDVFLWPYLAVLLENRLYDARNPSVKRSSFLSRLFKRNPTHSSSDVEPTSLLPSDVAISIENLNKTFNTSLFGSKKGLVTAVADLSLTIPKHGIFVLLGSNGAGKSTTLSVLAGLTGRTSGVVRFNTEDGQGTTDKPPPGTMGIVPQKNVLFPELTCYQTLRVWKAIKKSKYSDDDEDIEQLLRDCDLGAKIHANADTLSGGQKRKLQLAIGLVAGSNIVLVDECTSGVDPLSRRALWRTLTSFRESRSIVFTTHFLDEADLLGDHIAILAAPGRLAAQGSPVTLKHNLGEGYTVQVVFDSQMLSEKDSLASGLGPSGDLLQEIRKHAENASLSVTSPRQASYHLKTKDPEAVENVLAMLDEKRNAFRIGSYDILGTSIEDIFLDLMHKDEANKATATSDEKERNSVTSLESGSVQPESFASPLKLTSGHAISPFRQALTIFHKRALIARRSWLPLALAVVVAVAASTIPLVFVRGRSPSCVKTFATSTNIPLYLPESPIDPFSLDDSSRVLDSPPGITSTLGNTTTIFRITDVSDNDTFVNDIKQNFRNLSLGGVSIDVNSGAALVAWEATAPGLTGPAMLNLASNILYNQALNSSDQTADTPTLILANYESFPPVAAGTLFALKWVAFFGAAMAVYPAFFAIYVSKERRSGVQAMQFSNGLSNTFGLWLGHLMFDWIFSVISATITIIIFAAVSNQFHGLGLFWVVLVLYGIAGTLFAYCMSLVVSSPLAAFAAVAGYQVIMFVLYLAGYLLTLTYAKTSNANKIITIIHFTLSVLSPVASTLRAAFISVNLFSLLCLGDTFTTSQIGNILHYGGPILYLILYCFVLMAILVWYDSSGSLRPSQGWLHLFRKSNSGPERSAAGEDVLKEAKEVSASDDLLRVLNVSKTFGKNKVVDNVSLGVSRDTIFALLGPNGAGKTTTFNMIRGDILPDTGDIFVAEASVVRNPKKARFSLGVCPQFTAIDSQMTVREHLLIYGQLKGVRRGAVLANDIVVLLKATGLAVYADRLASKLSGGNQRKLSLAIALIGNPAVVLIDEFSTGIDAKMKREMWKTLRNVAVGKSVIITTHSMEEASALATKVGILARRMLAVGTTESLSARYATYEVHFTTRNREELEKAQNLMARIPGARLADDVATRFEVPIQSQESDDSSKGTSLAQLFHVLSRSGDFTEYTVEKASLESVFLKVIRENKVLEEDTRMKKHWWQRQR